MIFSDCLQVLDAGDSIELDKWIFSTYHQVTFHHVILNLNSQKIDYSKESHLAGNDIITQSGVKLSFSNDFNAMVYDPNEWLMTSFSFSGK